MVALAAIAFSNGSDGVLGALPRLERSRLAVAGLDQELADVLELVGHEDKDLVVRRPLAMTLLGLTIGVGEHLGQALVLDDGLELEGVTGQMIDKVQQESVLARPPELSEVDAAEGQICLNRPAVAL